MKRRRRAPAAAAFAVCLTSFVLAGGEFTLAAFIGVADAPANRVTAASDFRAPSVDSSAIAKSAGGTRGFVKQGGTYHVYANVSDTGNPASGVATVAADVSLVSAGQSTAALVPGSFSVEGAAYNFRSAQLTADTPLAEGSRTYSVTAADSAANGGTQSGFSTMVDNTAPTATDVQTASGAATVALAEAGDSIMFTFSEPIDPESVLAGWNSGSANVVVRLVNGALAGSDTLQVYNAANVTQLPLGSVDLAAPGYVGGLLGGEIGLFGATGTASTMTMSGSTITVVLGTASGQAATTALLNSTMVWTPSATATDRAGNGVTAVTATETGAADREF
ncbi:MAG: large repetitive protein [Thermoleophilaceae bacterium]|nr:large repetitive protein [Thermoleophilaceae bacterium]